MKWMSSKTKNVFTSCSTDMMLIEVIVRLTMLLLAQVMLIQHEAKPSAITYELCEFLRLTQT